PLNLGWFTDICKVGVFVSWCGAGSAKFIELLVNFAQVALTNIPRLFEIRVTCDCEVAGRVVYFNCGFAVSDSRVEIELLVRARNLPEYEDVKTRARWRDFHVGVERLDDVIRPCSDVACLRVSATIQINSGEAIRKHEAYALFAADDRSGHSSAI